MATIGGSGGSHRQAKTAGLETPDRLFVDGMAALATGSDRLEIDARAHPGAVQLIVSGNGPTYSGNFTLGGGSVAYSGVGSFTVYASAGDYADEVRTGDGDDVFHLYGSGEPPSQMDIVDLGGGANDLLVADFSAVSGFVVSNRVSGGYYLFDAGGSSAIAYKGVERLRFIGGAQGDNVTGHEGADILEGRAGDDTLAGGGGGDDISGGTGSNAIDAGDGDDIVRSVSLGFDTVLGGAGNDMAIIDYSALTTAVTNVAGGEVAVGDGVDTRLVLTGVERIVIATGSGSDSIASQGGDDEIRTGAGADSLDGGGGDDQLDGGAGIDSMTGGDGDDTFVVDDSGDIVVELAAGGTDRVVASSAAYDLPDHVENLFAAGAVAHRFRANAGDNVVAGESGNDTLLLQDGGADSAFGHAGNDILYFGAAFTGLDRADGGSGRDVVVLQGNYSLTFGESSVIAMESISLQSGANSYFGDTANNYYDFAIATADGNVAAGQQLIVNGQSLRAGEDFTFDGSAERDGKFLVYGGHGVDTLLGGAGGDVFFFEGNRWGPSDTVDGGGGRDALVLSGMSGLNRYLFGATSFANIESISVNALYASDPSQKPAYELVLHNANVAAGGTLIVNGSSLASHLQYLRVDGSAIQNGNLILYGGVANDRLKGGGGEDVLVGGPGSDLLHGGGGKDIFRYDSPSHSNPSAIDSIFDFAPAEDLIDLSRIDANPHVPGDQAFGWIGQDAFSGAGASSAGELRAYFSVNQWFFQGDTNGDGAADFTIAMLTPSDDYVPGAADFIL
jgi:Ca2+-binding RTX toxin-like protein